MKVAIIGSRSFTNYSFLRTHLINEDIKEIIISDSPGIDSLAERYAIDEQIPTTRFIAKWDNLSQPGAVIKTNKWGNKYDSNAGFRRDESIIKSVDKIIVFWDSKSPGILNSMKKAKTLGKKIKLIKFKDE
tara:strand:- start:1814 stop:2206 length:393 start_codon:yes stop_codon:yes gene_type:complete